MFRAILLGVFSALAMSAAAQPSFDCAKASSSVEELICNDESLAALDARLATRYAAAIEGAGTAHDTLRAMQRGWIKGRDDCWKAADVAECTAQSYLIREAELVALWMLEPARSIATYTCEGNPANEVTAFFFDTELPAVRIEYGDSISAGWSTPSGSGSKYALPFGGSFWIKGDEARFEWQEGQPMTCERSI